MLPSVGTPEEKVEAVYTKELHADNICAYHIGDIIWRAGGEAPVGFLLCNGAEVGRATYPKLFEVIGTKWGSGDGVTTFNLPNLIGKFPEGALEAGGYKEAGLPNIEGSINSPANFAFSMGQNYNEGDTTVSGAFANSVNGGYSHNSTIGNFNNKLKSIVLNASLSNPIYGNSDTVQPPSTLLIPYVKAFKGASADSTDLAISEVANDVLRISADMVKKSEADYIVDSYHDADGNWYRKYSDGWVEQGGKCEENWTQITFLKPFSDTNYNVTLTSGTDSGTANVSPAAKNRTTTTMSAFFDRTIANMWSAYGLGAKE